MCVRESAMGKEGMGWVGSQVSLRVKVGFLVLCLALTLSCWRRVVGGGRSGPAGSAVIARRSGTAQNYLETPNLLV